MDGGNHHVTWLIEGKCGTVKDATMTPYEGLPVLFGLCGYWLLTGLFASQLLKYFTHYGLSDRVVVRVTVYIIALTTIVYSSSVTFIVWRFFSRPHTSSGGAPVALPVLSTLPSPTIAFVSTVVHSFFVWRMHMLRRTSRSVSCVCVFVVSLSLTQFICAIINFAQFNISGRRPSGKRSFNTLTTLWLIGDLTCDIIITITTYVLLFQVRGQSTMKGTSKLLTKLISGTLETGLPTSIMAAAVLVTFVAYAETNFDLCFMFMLYIVYANAFLTALNSRRHLRDMSSNTMTSTGIQAAMGGTSTGIDSNGFKDGSPLELRKSEVDLEAFRTQALQPYCLNEVDITDRGQL